MQNAKKLICLGYCTLCGLPIRDGQVKSYTQTESAYGWYIEARHQECDSNAADRYREYLTECARRMRMGDELN